MKQVTAQGEQEKLSMGGGGDRQKRGEPVVKSIGITDGKTEKNALSATEYIDLLCQQANHGGTGKEVGETLRARITTWTLFRRN